MVVELPHATVAVAPHTAIKPAIIIRPTSLVTLGSVPLFKRLHVFLI
jgi:hypothetical protein